MWDVTIKSFRDANSSGVRSLHAGRHCPISAASEQKGLLKKLALGVLLCHFAVVSLSGCRSMQAEANVTKPNAAHMPASKSTWPRMVTVPAGTTLLISLNSSLRTDREKQGDGFVARLYAPVRVDQMTVLPVGTEVRGRLAVVDESFCAAQKAKMTLVFDRVVDPSGRVLTISIAPIVLIAETAMISDAQLGRGEAVVGIVRGVLSNSIHRAIGQPIGGAITLVTAGTQIKLPATQQFALDLDKSVRVSVTQQTASR